MARPRKYIRIVENPDGSIRQVEHPHGREIHGLSIHKPTGMFYTIRDGVRHYLARLQDAVNFAESSRMFIVHTEGERTLTRINPAFMDQATPPEQDIAVRKFFRLPNQGPIFAANNEPASPEKLSDCLAYWKTQKETKDRRPGYIEENYRIFNELITLIGDKPCNHVAQDDIDKFEAYISKESKQFTNDWYMRRIKVLRAIFNLCLRKSKFPLPGNLAIWIKDIEARAVVPAGTNKKSLPPEVFRDMLSVLSDNKRDSIQFRAILLLACQCALGNQDISDCKWDNIILDDAPHINFPRPKAHWKIGFDVPRVTPLLPETVDALKAWKKHEKSKTLVFVSNTKGKWKYDGISRVFQDIKSKTTHKESIWSFKHLRNVVGDCGRKAGLPDWMAEAVLGHVGKSLAAKRYIDDPQPEMLAPVVQAIKASYF